MARPLDALLGAAAAAAAPACAPAGPPAHVACVTAESNCNRSERAAHQHAMDNRRHRCSWQHRLQVCITWASRAARRAEHTRGARLAWAGRAAKRASQPVPCSCRVELQSGGRADAFWCAPGCRAGRGRPASYGAQRPELLCHARGCARWGGLPSAPCSHCLAPAAGLLASQVACAARPGRSSGPDTRLAFHSNCAVGSEVMFTCRLLAMDCVPWPRTEPHEPESTEKVRSM